MDRKQQISFFPNSQSLHHQAKMHIHTLCNGWVICKLIFGDRYLENVRKITLTANDKVRIMSEQPTNLFGCELRSLAPAQGRLSLALTCAYLRMIQIQCFVIYTFMVHVCFLSLPPLPNKTCNTHVLDSFKPRECKRIRKGVEGGLHGDAKNRWSHIVVLFI